MWSVECQYYIFRELWSIPPFTTLSFAWLISFLCVSILESPVGNLLVPDNSRHGSDGVQLFDRVHSTGITNGFDSQSAADLGDSEVQEILGNDTTAAVQVLVEMNGQDDDTTEAGWMPCLCTLCLLNVFCIKISILLAEFHPILLILVVRISCYIKTILCHFHHTWQSVSRKFLRVFAFSLWGISFNIQDMFCISFWFIV